MSKRYTLGIDIGGSASKATLLDESGKVVTTAACEYRSYYPHPGWVEQVPDELFTALVANIRKCLQQSQIDPGAIVALAIDAATHMAVFCDEDDRPLRNLIHWSDSRSTQYVELLKSKAGGLLKAHSANSVSAAWTLPQILWLNANEPEIIRKTKRVYFCKDYLRHRITGDFFTDNIESMGAMLADDYKQQWDDDLCDLAGISSSVLPEIRDASDIAGGVSKEFAKLTGLKQGMPVIIGTTDTVMEVYASGAVSQGCATIKLATAGRICPITDHPIQSHQFFNYRHIIPGKWYPGTGTRTCAASYKWYRDTFGSMEAQTAVQLNTSTYEVMNRAAEEVPAGSEGLFFHPFLQGEMTPYYDDALCASFTGVRMHHTKGHFTRAVMEGISYSMLDCLNEVKAQKINVHEYRLIGGGAKGKLWRQILADVLATPLTCMIDNDSSLGSAMLAGVATGLFCDYQDSVDKCVAISGQVLPIEENVQVYQKGFKTYQSIVEALSVIYHSVQ